VAFECLIRVAQRYQLALIGNGCAGAPAARIWGTYVLKKGVQKNMQGLLAQHTVRSSAVTGPLADIAKYLD
jgi:hypothetical protein